MKHPQEWREAIRELPVFDTHTHLNNPGVPIPAHSVWDIVEYFWFRQELGAVGYPHDAETLPETERIDRFVGAWRLARNTVWARMIGQTFRDLYGLELTDAASVRAANEAVRASAANLAWPRQVLDRLHVKRITVNLGDRADYPGLPGVGVAVPIWNGYKEWTRRILDAEDPRPGGEAAAAAIARDVAAIRARGIRGMRVHPHAFQQASREDSVAAILRGHELPAGRALPWEAEAFLAHALLRALGDHGMFAQLFLGIVGIPGGRELMAVNDPHAITGLYPLFERYGCGFELVAGAPGHNLDVVQAARIHPHVHAGGLWWYNFRPSTYREAMRVRLEALPAGKSVLLASDARCIEWCYAKTLLVKNLLADFLCEVVNTDHIDQADALWVAREWLHDAAERRYL